VAVAFSPIREEIELAPDPQMPQGDPPEVPPATPGTPTEPPREMPPGNPKPDVPPPMHEPDAPQVPQELPGQTPDEFPVRGPQTPQGPSPPSD
jgi:hypothetical protein